MSSLYVVRRRATTPRADATNDPGAAGVGWGEHLVVASATLVCAVLAYFWLSYLGAGTLLSIRSRAQQLKSPVMSFFNDGGAAAAPPSLAEQMLRTKAVFEEEQRSPNPCQRCHSCNVASSSDCSPASDESSTWGHAAEDSALQSARATWLEQLECPIHRSLWVVSTLAPHDAVGAANARAHNTVDRLRQLSESSSWGALLVGTAAAQPSLLAPAPPLFTRLGPAVVVMNLTLDVLESGLPFETAHVLAQQLRFRAEHEWGRVGGSRGSSARKGGSGSAGEPLASNADALLLGADGRLHVALKMLAYLVAIKCGAEAIFDSVEDDVGLFTEALQPVSPHSLSQRFAPAERNYTALPGFVEVPSLEDLPQWPVLLTPRAVDIAPVVNPYASLGGRSVFPRGFPSEHAYNASFQALHLQRQAHAVRPLVQQWVSHAYPDLSHGDKAALLTHELPKLMPQSPTVLMGDHAFAPFNTRGTLFLPGAFWALFLSPAQSAYTADILRAYWAQPVLWAMGAQVAFRTTGSPAPNPTACGELDFRHHSPRISGGCEGAGHVLRDILGDRSRRRQLLRDDLDLQHALPPLVQFLDGWKPPPAAAVGGGDVLDAARSLMCGLAQGSHLATCRDCTALRAWMRDLGAVGYTAPSLPSPPPSVDSPFFLQRPDPSVLSFNQQTGRATAGGSVSSTTPAAGSPAFPRRKRALAVCLTGLADRISTRLVPEDIQTPFYKRAPTPDTLLLAHNLARLSTAFGGPEQVHVFGVLGSHSTHEQNLRLLIQGKLPFVDVVVHRDWVLEPLLAPREQARMPRYNASYVKLRWTNEAQHYQRSQLHQVWQEAKCWEMVAAWSARLGVEYTSVLRHRSDFNVLLWPTEAEGAAVIAAWTAAPNWGDTVFIPEGEDWRGINDRVALGGPRAMAAYLLRYWSLHAALWEPGWSDYNHLWAEPFLNWTLQGQGAGGGGFRVLRGRGLNYSEFEEVAPPGVYLGDEAA